VSVPQPTDAECRRFYEANAELFVAGELVEARHILFAVTPRTPVDALRGKAEQTLHELRRHPERFAARARELSNCPSGAQGGELGQIARGDCVPEFEREIFGATALGVLPALVNTRFGFHVVCVDRRAPGRRAPFDSVRHDVAARMARQAWRRALGQYARLLADQASAGGTRSADPLVQ
jgi:peptidyl-prolyl cis-trans isomerase C